MTGGGCCNSGDEGVRALLSKWALVFLDIAFLDDIKDVLLTFLFETSLRPFLYLQNKVYSQNWLRRGPSNT